MQGERPETVNHVTEPVVAVAADLPAWATVIRAANPGPMTLDGTNTWRLSAAADGAAIVVDPGPSAEEHLRAVAARGPVAAVLVTHGHLDHVGGLDRFLELTGAPLLRPEPDEPVTRAGLTITAVPTPGHTSDSVCFLVAGGGQQAMLTGDTILGRGTTVVAWPDGDLGDYLTSLEHLTRFVGVPALPGHGPALTDCAAAAAYYLNHRRARLAQVRAAVAAGATTPAAVVERVYQDVDRSLREAAEWSVRAQLAYLERTDPGPAPVPRTAKAAGERESSGASPPLDPL